MLWTAKDLLSHKFPDAFLVEPIIPRQGIVFFHGKRNIGKSQLALTLAICLAERGILFGKYPTHVYGPVVYVQADMPAAIQQMRILAIQHYYSLDQLHFYFPRYFNLALVTSHHPDIRAIADLKPCMIVWDTLRKVQRLKTNDDDVPSFIYSKVQDMFPDATHFFTHHDKKDVVDGDTLDPDEKFRGSGAWLDDADTGLHLRKVSNSRLVLDFSKSRASEPQVSLPLVMHPETLLLYATGEQLPKMVQQWNGKPRIELRQHLLASFVASPHSIDQLLERAL
jgi:hypothetical protein